VTEPPQWPQQWQQPPPGYGYQPYGYGGYGPPGPPPPSHIAIPAFIYSSRVEPAWYRGDVAGAQRASATARTCGVWALVAGVVLFVIWIAVFVALVSSAHFVTP
jgi:hypothetical protein